MSAWLREMEAALNDATLAEDFLLRKLPTNALINVVAVKNRLKRIVLLKASASGVELGAGAEPVHREVVKLVTSSWHDKRGLHIRRDLLAVKRKSSGHQCLDEDCSMVGADEVWPRIVNLGECQDGLYEVVICNEWRDYETGHIEDYDYRLVAFCGGGEETANGTPASGYAKVSHDAGSGASAATKGDKLP